MGRGTYQVGLFFLFFFFFFFFFLNIYFFLLCGMELHLYPLAPFLLRQPFYQKSQNNILFVSPELSSGRDLVIQMSVRRAPSAVHGFLSGAYLRNCMTYLHDIWYVGGLGLMLRMLNFGRGRCILST